MRIDDNGQCENAYSPISESAEPDSNVTVERDRHSRKQAHWSSWTERGTQIETSVQHLENAERSINARVELGSNVTTDMDGLPKKHSSPSLATDEGIHILSFGFSLPTQVASICTS